MKAPSFVEYVQQRRQMAPQHEALQRQEKEVGPITSKISLGDGNDLSPFVISDDPNSEHYGKNRDLAPLVRAFKKGGNWGWTKDDSSGEEKPVKISGRRLFITGGAARDHLLGRKPKHLEMVTNSSPDEVYHLLKQNDFAFVHYDPKTELGKYFWMAETDKMNRPYSFGIRINKTLISLDLFRKTPRGVDGEVESGTHSDDAAGRDFTMNALAIALSQDNGPNKELHDFHGGIHDLLNGRVKSIGNTEQKMAEEPTRLLRYARMLHTYGDPNSVPAEDRQAIQNSIPHLGKVKPEKIQAELEKALERDDTDSRKYLQTLSDLGILNAIFPGKELDTQFPKELTELGDRHMPLAWMLRNNPPEALNDVPLPAGAMKKVGALLRAQGLNPDVDENGLEDILNSFRESGVSPRKLKGWAKMIGLDPNVVDAFLRYQKTPRVKTLETSPEGEEQATEGFRDLFDPFTKELSGEANHRRRQLELENFRKILRATLNG